ncbi:MAG: SUMF1/EgtB/PvdO family nonheme iron enzyme [Blastocatellia bacterium]
MMYCDRCNIDFADGLRYCKWCGQTLVERRRDTSELQSCPACSAAIKSGWAFCKSCGEPLDGSPRETASAACPRCNATTDLASRNCTRCGLDLTNGRDSGRITNSDAAQTSVIANCPSCGELLEPGSIYCKACGSALYEQQSPFGSSALLCSVCNSYSPLGSTTCRVCGALLIETEMDLSRRAGEATSTEREKSSTLPDLADHLPDTELVAIPAGPEDQTLQPDAAEVESGAHTIVFADSEHAQPGKPVEEPGDSRDKFAAPGKATSVLPGVSGSRFEQPAPTSVFNQTRITGPVDPDSPEGAPPSDSQDEPSDAYSPLATRVAVEGFPADKNDEPGQGTSVLGSDADLRDAVSKLSGHRTVVFGSDSAERENELATTQWGAELPAERGEIMTAPFGVAPPLADAQDAIGTRVMRQEAKDEDAVAAGDAGMADHSAAASLRTNKEIPVARIDDQVAVAQPAPRHKKSIAVPFSVAALIALALALSAAWYFLSGRRGPGTPPQEPPAAEAPAAEPPVTPTAPAPPRPPASPATPEGMAMVAGGSYIIGRDDADPLEKPRHTVALSSFFIDRTEVTNADYKRFVDATGHKPPPNWKGGSYPEGKGNYPVTSVTWDDATEYAAWAGKRLPTEAEWEAAARGADGRIYPWGDQWQPAFSNIGLKPKSLTPSVYSGDIKQVGEFPQGASAVGALDMIGNVWEWTADEFALYEGGIKKLPIKTEPGKVYRVIRGGAFDGSEIHDASYRGLLDASQPYPKVGFRCVKDAPGGKQ